MKISVEISEKELDEIRKYSNESQKGPALRKLALEALMIRKRKMLGEKVLSGELSIELPNLGKLREDRL